MSGLGDFDPSTVVYGKFTTYRPSTGAPFTLGGTPALSVYKDNSTTQSTAGVTLTVDFDGLTGFNHFAINTAADGAFYSAGSFFDIVITTGTVDSVSTVGSVVGSFTIHEVSSLRPTTVNRTLDVSINGEAGIDWANVGSPTTALALTNTTISPTQVVASVTAGVSVGTGGIVAGSFAAGAIDAAAIDTDAIGAAEISAAAVTKIQTGLATPTNIVSGTLTTVTNLTNLPSIPANWLTAAGLAADAVAEIQAGLATPTNIVSGTLTTVTNLTNLPSIPANWLTAAGLAADAVTDIQTGLATFANQTAQGTQITWLQNFLAGDKSIDTAVTPWAEVVKIAGTGTELIRKKLRDVSGTNITATTVVIGSAKDA